MTEAARSNTKSAKVKTNGEDECTLADMHTHFYCEACHRTFCLKDISAPIVDLPEGFLTYSVNYIIKGICPECRK